MSKITHSRRGFLKAMGLGAAALVAPGFAFAASDRKKKPNIIFFLVDDMGWMDSTVYGSRYYDTPNMERLARRSMMFTDAYAANPLCSPTRASILTGKYPARLKITTPAGHLPPLPDQPLMPDKAPPRWKTICPRSRRFLPPEEYTIAEALRDAGYKTAHIGKWHLGVNPEHWPEVQGFDFSFHGAPDPGPRSYFSPYLFRAGTITDGPEGEYITDRVTDETLKFIEANRDGPFLLHLWHYSVHGPWGHKKKITERYVGKKDPRGKQGNPIMASMLWSVDESLGRILDKLDELGIADDTIIIFFSDNGGNTHSNGPFDSKVSKIKKGHPRWAWLQEWRKYADSLPPTNNYPLRGGKATIYEGGTREPLLICWPGVVKPGSKCSEVVSSIDFYPTMLEMAGVKPREGQIIDGVSIVPLLKQTGKLEREAIFCHFPHRLGRLNAPSTYVRKGDWKLIRFYETNEFFPNRYELYNLKDDIGETNNLADRMPDKVKELDALIDKFIADTGAIVPKPNPAYDPTVAALSGWVNKNCEVSVHDGVVTMQCTGKQSFLATASFKQSGPVLIKFRAKSTGGGGGRIQWRTANQPEFPRQGQVEDFDLPGDGKWHEVQVEIPTKGLLIHVRIFPGTKPGVVDIDWIRFYAAKGPGTEPEHAWEFEGK